MSTEICVQNYCFQGQVYSPAFSEPPSPSSIDSFSDDDMDNPLSPMSTNSDMCDDVQIVQTPRTSKKSFKRSNSDGDLCQYKSKVPKYANKYEELLQPLSPVTTLPCLVVPPLPLRSKPCDKKLQAEFESVIVDGSKDDVEAFLSKHSCDVNVNLYNSQGRTSLQQSCLDGNLELAKTLVKYGADHRLTTRDGFSTMNIAVFSGHSNLLMYILSLQRR